MRWNILKKSEFIKERWGVPIFKLWGGSRGPTFKFEGSPGVPLLNFRGGSRVPGSKVLKSHVPGSRSWSYICRLEYVLEVLCNSNLCPVSRWFSVFKFDLNHSFHVEHKLIIKRANVALKWKRVSKLRQLPPGHKKYTELTWDVQKAPRTSS